MSKNALARHFCIFVGNNDELEGGMRSAAESTYDPILATLQHG